MRVFVDNCEPIDVYDFGTNKVVSAIESLESNINRRLDTLISRTPTCLTTGELEIIHCINTGDTLTVAANTVNKINIYASYSSGISLSIGGSPFYDLDFNSQINIFPIEADNCQLLATEVKYICLDAKYYIVTTK